MQCPLYKLIIISDLVTPDTDGRIQQFQHHRRSKLIVMSESSLEGPILRGEVFKQVMSHVHIVIIIMSLMPPWRTVVWQALHQRQGAVQRNTSIYNENNKKIYHLSDCKIIHAY